MNAHRYQWTVRWVVFCITAGVVLQAVEVLRGGG